jgi:hypothetical protein
MAMIGAVMVRLEECMQRTVRRAWEASLLTAALTLGAWHTVDAHHAVLRFNLEEMTLTADRVFVGACVGIEPTREFIAGGNLSVTRYTFDVEQVLKGEVPARLTFTQLGHPARPARNGELSSHGLAVERGLTLHGAAEFGVGDRLMMFLIPDYQNGRLTYPVGLDQGAFMLEADATGQIVARNDLNNLGLFTAPFNGTRMTERDARVVHPEAAETISKSVGLSDAARSLSDKRGALPLAPLMELIQRIHEEHGGAKGRVVGDPKGGR